MITYNQLKRVWDLEERTAKSLLISIKYNFGDESIMIEKYKKTASLSKKMEYKYIGQTKDN